MESKLSGLMEASEEQYSVISGTGPQARARGRGRACVTLAPYLLLPTRSFLYRAVS